MNYRISEKTKQLAKKCHCNFCCLKGEDICSVFIKLKDNLLIKEPAEKDVCRYKTKVGRKSLCCRCPVRYELYHNYKI